MTSSMFLCLDAKKPSVGLVAGEKKTCGVKSNYMVRSMFL
jgi:hypothetical protein